MPRRGDPSGRPFPSMLLTKFKLSRLFEEAVEETHHYLKLATFQRISQNNNMLNFLSSGSAVPPVLTCRADGSSWPSAGG